MTIRRGPIARRRSRGRRGAGRRPLRRPSIILEPLEPRLLLSADTLVPGLAAAFDNGLGKVGAALQELIDTDPNFDKPVPAVLKTVMEGDSELRVSPTAREMFALDRDLDPDLSTSNIPDIGVADGKVSWREAWEALFIAPLREFLDVDFDATGKGIGNLRNEFVAFLSGLTEPGNVNNVIDLEIGGVTSADTGSELEFTLDVTLGLKRDLVVDLGAEAAELKIVLPQTALSTPPSAVELPVSGEVEFTQLTFGVDVDTSGTPTPPVVPNDFFITVPDALRVAVDIENIAGGPVAKVFELNVGFLGASASGTIKLQMGLDVEVTDPSDPIALGFEASQLGVFQTGGEIVGNVAPADTDLPAEIRFTLDVGEHTTYAAPEIVVPDNDRTTLAQLLDDVDAAINADPDLGPRIVVEEDSGKIKIRLSDDLDDPNPLGFGQQQWSAAGILTAALAPSILGTMVSDTIRFLLSASGQFPKLVAVTPTPAGDEGDADPSDDNLTLAGLESDLQDAVDAAGFDITVSTAGGKLVLTENTGQSLEITRTLTIDADGKIRVDEIENAATNGMLRAAIEADPRLEVTLLITPDPSFGGVPVSGLPAPVTLEVDIDPFSDTSLVAVETEELLSFELEDAVSGVPLKEIVTGGWEDVLDFTAIGATEVVGLVGQMKAFIDRLPESVEMFGGFDIPFADAVLGEILDFANLVEKTLLFDPGPDGEVGTGDDVPGLLMVVEDQFTPFFRTAQELAWRLDTIVEGILGGAFDVQAAYSTTTEELSYRIQLEREFLSLEVPIDFNLDLEPLVDLFTEGGIEIAATGEVNLRLALKLGEGAGELTGSESLAEGGPLNGGMGVDIRELLGVTGAVDVSKIHGRLSQDATFDLRVVTLAPFTDGTNGIDFVDGGVGTPDTILRNDGGSWSTDGYEAGMQVRIGNVAAGNEDNEGTFTLQSVSDDTLTLIASDTLASFSADTDAVLQASRVIPVTVTAGATKANTLTSQLVTQITTALDGALTPFGLDGKIQARAAGPRVELFATDGTILGFEVDASSGNTAFTQLGLEPESAVSVALRANKVPPSLRLGSSTSFSVDLNGAGSPTAVFVSASSTAENNTFSDLLDDINDGLRAANLGDKLVATKEGDRVRLGGIDPTVSFIEITAGSIALGLETGQTASVSLMGAELTGDGQDGTIAPLGRLAAAVNFQVNGTPITITKAATADNIGLDGIDDTPGVRDGLIEDINKELSDAGLDIRAESFGGTRIVFRATDASVSTLTVTAVPEFGFATTQTADAKLSVVANRDAPFFVGPRAEATFDVTVTGGPSAGTYTVHVGTDPAGAVDGAGINRDPSIDNRSIFDLVADVNDALEDALRQEDLTNGTATSGGSATVLTDTAADFVAAGVQVGDVVVNVSDNSSAVVTSRTATTLTTTALRGGVSNTWTTDDEYRVDRPSPIVANNDGGRLVLELRSDANGNPAGPAIGVTAFTVTPDSAGDPAVIDLKLQHLEDILKGDPPGTSAGTLTLDANRADLLIVTRGQEVELVELDGLTTLQQVIDAIDAVTDVTAGLNENLTGLELQNKTGPDVGELFRVDSVNASPSAFHLGIFGSDINLLTATEPTVFITEPDDTIDGEAIGSTDLATRLFLDEVDGSTPLLRAEAKLQVAGDVKAGATFGFAGVEISPRPALKGNADAGGSATTLVDADVTFTGVVDEGDMVVNVTDGSRAEVVSVAANTLTLKGLQGGSDNTWQAGDVYKVFEPLIEAKVEAGLRDRVSLVELFEAVNGEILSEFKVPSFQVTTPQSIILDIDIKPDTLGSLIELGVDPKIEFQLPGSLGNPFGRVQLAAAADPIGNFRLTSAASFVVQINGGDRFKVDLSEAATSGNGSLQDLVDTLNTALESAIPVDADGVPTGAPAENIRDRVEAAASGARIKLEGIADSVDFFKVSALESFEAGVAELGLALEQASVNLPDVSVLGTQDPTFPLNLAEDLQFGIRLNGLAEKTVTLASGTYSTLDELVTAMNTALGNAELGGLLRAVKDGTRLKLESVIDSLESLDEAAGFFRLAGEVSELGFVEDGLDGINNLLSENAPDINVDFDALDLGDLFSLQDISFGSIIEGLRILVDFLGQFADLSFLDSEIPLIGVSVNELLEIADQFADAFDEIQQNPASAIQLLEQKIRESFGLPPGVLGLIAASDPIGTFQLTSAATFVVQVNDQRFQVTVPEGATTDNGDIAALAEDLSNALVSAIPIDADGNPTGAAQDITDRVDAFVEGTRLRLQAVNSAVNFFKTIADGADPAVTELGFAALDTLAQNLAAAAFQALGIDDPNAQVFSMSLVDDPDDVGEKILRMDLRLPVGFNEALPIDLDLEAGIFSIQGQAGLAASGSLDARLAFGIDLEDPTRIVLFDGGTSITGRFDARGDNLTFNAAVGPLGVFIANGVAAVDVDFQIANGQSDPNHIIEIGDISFSPGDAGAFGASLTGTIGATLPVFFPTRSTFLGDIEFSTGLSVDSSNGLVIDPPTLTFPDFEDLFGDFNLFNSIPLLIDGFDLILEGIQDILSGQVFGIDIPLIGDKLKAGAEFVEDFREDVVDPFRDFVESLTAADPGEILRRFLFVIMGPGSDALEGIPGVDPGITGDTLFDELFAIFPALQDVSIPGLDLLSSFSTGFSLPEPGDADFVTFMQNLLGDPGTLIDNIAEYIPFNFDLDGADGDDFIQWDFRLKDEFTPGIDLDFDLGFPALGLDVDADLNVEIGWDLALGIGVSLADGVYLDILNPRKSDASATEDDVIDDVLVTLDVGFGGQFAGGADVTFASTGGANGTITRDAGSWTDDNFEVDQTIRVDGSTSNDGDFKVTGVTDAVLTVQKITGGLSGEGPVGGVLIASLDSLTGRVAFLQLDIVNQFDNVDEFLFDGTTPNPGIGNDPDPDTTSFHGSFSVDIFNERDPQFDGTASFSGNQITRSGTWSSDDFAMGQRVRVSGSEKKNDGDYTVSGISAGTLTLDGASFTTETDAEIKVRALSGENVDERLSFSELGQLDAQVLLAADADVNLQITGSFNEAILPDAISALLPSVEARFVLDWATEIDITDGFSVSGGLSMVEFRDVAIDLGSFLGDTLGPVVSKIQEITEPIQPIIEVVTTRIPVISDLAGRTVTLLDIAEQFGVVNVAMIRAIADIITLVNSIPADVGELKLPLGDFPILGNPSAEDLANPNFDLSNPESLDIGQVLGDLGFIDSIAGFVGQVDDLLGGAFGALTGEQQQTASTVKNLVSNSGEDSESGFAFPFLESPSEIFGLLLGRPATIVTYDLAPFSFEFTYEQSFPIWGPLFALLQGTVGINIDFAFGYDTEGVKRFIEGDFANPLDLLAGFFVSDTDLPSGTGGTDVPELTLKGEIFAGAEINLGIASAGVIGGIILTVNFDLYDPDHDGRVRVDELLNSFLFEFREGNPVLAPIAIFDVFGDVAAQLRAFFKALFFKKTFNITPEITLFEFSIPFEREPILATERGDGVVLLNMGPNAGLRENGNVSDVGERFFVRTEGDTIKVWAPDLGVSSGSAQSYKGTFIKAIGGEGNDVIDLSGVTNTAVTAEIEGGAGNDILKAGAGAAQIKGGLGDDVIVGGAGQDVLIGGEGHDQIRGEPEGATSGAGDLIFADSGSITFAFRTSDTEELNPVRDRIFALVEDTDGQDEVFGGPGDDIIFGGGGADVLSGGEGDDLIFGDGGRFDFARDGSDEPLGSIPDIDELKSRGEGGNDVIYGNAGNDTVLAGAGIDFIDGGADDDEIFGQAGEDTIYGGSGSDSISGGPDDDVIFGNRDPQHATMLLLGVETADEDADDTVDPDLGDYLRGDAGNDLIRGNDAADVLLGGEGADFLFGDEDDDFLFGENDSDILFGGGGNDTVESMTNALTGAHPSDAIPGLVIRPGASAGNDIVFGDDGLVAFFDRFAAAAEFTDATNGIDFNDANPDTIVRNDGGSFIDDGYAEGMVLTVSSASDPANDGTYLITRVQDSSLTLRSDAELTAAVADTTAVLNARVSVFDVPGSRVRVTAEGHRLIGDGVDGSLGAGALSLAPFAASDDDNPLTLDLMITQLNPGAADGEHDGSDTIVGGSGEDFVFGGAEGDTEFGDFDPAAPPEGPRPTGTDVLVGDGGFVQLLNRRLSLIRTDPGAEGEDTIAGNDNTDYIFGGSSDDTLFGFSVDTATGDVTDPTNGFDFTDTGAGTIVRNDGGSWLTDAFRPGMLVTVTNAAESANDGTYAIIKVTDSTLFLDEAESLTPSSGDTSASIRGAFSPFPGLADDDFIIGDDGQIEFTTEGIVSRVVTDRSPGAQPTGGEDTADGNEGEDVILGGFEGDDLEGALGSDVLVGDNGELLFLTRFTLTGPNEVSVANGRLTGDATFELLFTRPVSDAENGLDFNDANPDTIVRTAGSWIDDSFVLGMTVTVQNATDPANDGTYEVTGVTDTTLTLDGTLATSLDDTSAVVVVKETVFVAQADTAENAGIDDLIDDVRAALDAVGLGDRIGVRRIGAVLQLVSIDPSIQRLNLTASESDPAATEMGFLAQRALKTAVIESIRTTDDANDTGGPDDIRGSEGDDILIGGVNGNPTPDPDELFGSVGTDILLGDNAQLLYGEETDPNHPDAGEGPLMSDPDLSTLDVIETLPFALDGVTILGGADHIEGNAGEDIAMGGVAGDDIFGDDEDQTAGTDDGTDILLGDNGRIVLLGEPGILRALSTAVDTIQTTDDANETGGADRIRGSLAPDVILGGVNGVVLGPMDPPMDELYGNDDAFGDPALLDDGDDVILGDNGLLDFGVDFDRRALDLIETNPYASDLTTVLGGPDLIAGNAGQDTAMGGVGGDFIFGDDPDRTAAALDLDDMLLGDNGRIDLLPVPGEFVFFGGAVETTRATDDVRETGGSDEISGDAGSDIIAGGVFGDLLHGYAALDPGEADEDDLLDGADVILGDNARLAWSSDGDFEDVNADMSEVNPDLAGLATTPDTDLGTLDLVTTELPDVTTLPDDLPGGRDLIFGDAGRDVVFGGTSTDEIWGDDGDETGDGSDAQNDDLLFGDHGRLYPQFSVIDPGNKNAFPSRNFFAIDIEFDKGGEGDLVFGEEGDDVILGQQGDDRLFGGDDDDDMIGGHNVETGIDELGSVIEAVAFPASPINDLMDGDRGDDAMAGDNAALWRNPSDPFVPGAFDITSPRFRVLVDPAGTIYDENGIPQVTEEAQEDPNGSVGRTIILLDHDAALEGNPAPRPFGADYMAGGPDADILFGELADDVVQGDGSIDQAADGDPASPSFRIDVDDSGPEPRVGDTDATLWFNVAEAFTDGDDYMEGGGGGDLLFGGLGQDDIIGGNSDLFGLDTPGLPDAEKDPLRPDGSDVIFGGAANATRLARNDYVGSGEFGDVDDDPQIMLEDRHARDADVIVGDNADILRLVAVEAGESSFLTFNYDALDEARGDLRIVPRGVLLLDYDPDPAVESLGAGDLIHGESGDDLIHGETGDDVLYGESDDDDVIGEKGDDWISSGTGEDGILGDDGIVFSSRNSEVYGEPLYGIEPVDEVDKLIRTPGNIQRAIIQAADRLNKSVDLVAFEFGGNDIVFGGLDDDFIHAGEGDDAVSGAEALPFYYSLEEIAGIDGNDLLAAQRHLLDPDADPTVPLSDLLSPPAAIDLVTPFNPGNALYFEKFRESEFALYDEFNPRRKIMLDALGQAVSTFRDDMGILEYRSITTLEAIFDDNTNLPAPVEFEVLLGKPSGQEAVTLVTVGPGDFGTKEGLRDAINEAIADAGIGKTVAAELTDEGDLRLVVIQGNADREVAVRVTVTNVFPYLVNFDPTEGRLDERWVRFDDEPVPTDGDDRIFGDTGNDWIVGGTGRDHMYGGRGDDLLNMDDDHDSTAGLWPDVEGPKPHDPPRDELDNNLPDPLQAYADIVYGGGGRDVLILNTGADRAIDWVGEFNSYLTPFAPFGAFHISRNLSPHTEQFLLDLSRADGTDQTVPDRVRFEADRVIDPRIDDPDPLRNGEPYGELGMIRQQDLDWNDQTGGPDDPQAGNLQGPRIIMRRALFNDEEGTKGAPKDFAIAVESGTWTVGGGTLNVAAELGSEAVSFYYVDEILPSYFEILTTINAAKDKAGVKSNAYIVFDWQSATDFKFAGVDVGLDKLRIGHRTAEGWIVDAQVPMQLVADRDYNIAVALHGTVATLYVWANGGRIATVSHAFGDPLAEPLVDPLNDGLIGLAVDNSITRFDNLEVRVLPPTITYSLELDFSDGFAPFAARSGLWALEQGRFVAQSVVEEEAALATLPLGVAPATFVEFGATFRTGALGGLVFDYYGPNDFKFAALRADSSAAVIGHYTREGWSFDAAADLAFDTSADHEVKVELRGGSVVMFVDGKAVLSHTFNSLLNDGAVGLLADGDGTSFDAVSLRHDDPAFASESLEGPALVTAAEAEGSGAVGVLTYDALTPIVDEAIRRWTETLVLDAESLAALESMSFAIADLPGTTLGVASGTTILLDADAAGYGWFVDPTPSKDAGFRWSGSELLAVPTGEAAGQMDLLTAVLHEIGHVLGLEDTPSDDGTAELMDDTLTVGTRRLPEASIGEGVEVAPDARIGEGVSLGEGTRVLAGARVGDGTWIGAGSVIGEGASIGLRALIGDGVTVAPGAVVPHGAVVLSGTVVASSEAPVGTRLGDVRARLEGVFGTIRTADRDAPWGLAD